MAAIILSLSGPSSSGKTTLARLLREIFPHTTILHEDDFYKPEKELPMIKMSDGKEYRDWDCTESLDLDELEKTIDYIHEHGKLPPNPYSKEDQNFAGPSGVSPSLIASYRTQVLASPTLSRLLSDDHPLFILDGFLLYTPALSCICQKLDIKLFLLSSFEAGKSRREQRPGYVTLPEEEFWVDPPRYFEEVVWKHFKEDHGFLFEDADVEKEVKGDVVKKLNLKVCRGSREWSMSMILGWAFGEVVGALERIENGKKE
ncbi:MAG: ribosylnicotinamide kinase [Cirrosporium novae-zelandiae]|nr:MAG: ribosylnicotinamide kinase [Cirrosporium novae-zelandiae]